MAVATQMGANSCERLDAIFRAHYERVARVIGRVIHDQARAEELAAEVFLKWWRKPRAQGEHAEGWLYRTAVRKALDELRSQTRRNRFERFLGRVPKSPPTPEELYTVNAEQQRVRTVLGALNRRHAEILLLRSQDFTFRLKMSEKPLSKLTDMARKHLYEDYLYLQVEEQNAVWKS